MILWSPHYQVWICRLKYLLWHKISYHMLHMVCNNKMSPDPLVIKLIFTISCGWNIWWSSICINNIFSRFCLTQTRILTLFRIRYFICFWTKKYYNYCIVQYQTYWNRFLRFLYFQLRQLPWHYHFYLSARPSITYSEYYLSFLIQALYTVPTIIASTFRCSITIKKPFLRSSHQLGYFLHLFPAWVELWMVFYISDTLLAGNESFQHILSKPLNVGKAK